MRTWDIQLHRASTRQALTQTGGKVYVAVAGDPQKATIYTFASLNSLPALASNPVDLANGRIQFGTADSVTTVDLYVQAPSGHFAVFRGVKSGVNSALYIDIDSLMTQYVIPFSMTSFPVVAENDTGFDLPVGSSVLPNAGVFVTTIDSTETLDVGTLTGEAGADPNGFLAAVSVATAGYVKGSVANGALTLGALLFVQDSVNAGDEAPEQHVVVTATQSISWTPTAGSDTMEGYIILNVMLNAILTASPNGL